MCLSVLSLSLSLSHGQTPTTHRQPYNCTDNAMLLTHKGRTIVGVVATLLLSARIDAFSLCPVAKSSAARYTYSRKAALSSSMLMGGARRAQAPGWVRTRSNSALSMTDGPSQISEITASDLDEREFQVCGVCKQKPV